MTQDELLQLIDQAAAEGWTELDLSGQGLTELPPEIGKLTQLETLIFGKVGAMEFPGGVPTPKVIANMLTHLPYEIQQLHKLKSLDLSGNPLGQLPEFLTSLESLTDLTATSISLPEIPIHICKFTNLRALWINFNQIKSIPDQVGQLCNLNKLGLSGNQISEIPACIARLENLEAVWMSSNRISVIPNFISHLAELRAFWITNNCINDIPNSFGSLTELVYLGLSDNQIKSIPECIGQLVRLRAIWLNKNEITNIPESVKNLVNLEELYLNNNAIQICPPLLEYLPKLTVLDLRYNPLPIYPEVLGLPDLEQPPGSIEEIFNYLKKLRNGEVKALNEAKLLLVGQGSVGKTSLIKQLMEGTFNPNEAQTDGLTVREWGVHVNSKDVRLNVWDFGGQEIYHATHQFFLTKRSLYILVCNCRTSEEENRIEYWLKLIQSFGGESPVIIVGNKSDEQPLDINRKALRQKYPNICAILETSCQTGQGIEELHATITEEVGKLREVYNLLPLS